MGITDPSANGRRVDVEAKKGRLMVKTCPAMYYMRYVIPVLEVSNGFRMGLHPLVMPVKKLQAVEKESAAVAIADDLVDVLPAKISRAALGQITSDY